MGARDMALEPMAGARTVPQLPGEARKLFWANPVPRDAKAVRDRVMPAWLPPLHQCVLVLANALDERPTDPRVLNWARDGLGRAGVPKKLLEPRVPLCHKAGLLRLPKPPALAKAPPLPPKPPL